MNNVYNVVVYDLLDEYSLTGVYVFASPVNILDFWSGLDTIYIKCLAKSKQCIAPTKIIPTNLLGIKTGRLHIKFCFQLF